MVSRCTACLACVASAAFGCAPASDDVDIARDGDANGELADAPGEFGITNIQDVWIFTHTHIGSALAPLIGAAEIQDNCLRVGERLVVWSVDDKAYAESLVKAVLAVESALVDSGGGSYTSVPAEVQERCPTKSVFIEGAASP